MPSSPATASAWSPRATTSRPARSPARSAPSRNVPPAVEEHVAAELGLSVEPVSTQVIPRDRHAMFFATLGVIASSIERLATEIRHLQRTEVLEAEEYFSPGQKGSSAMPHKRNPVLTENLTGLARMVRGYVTPALENVALWHERDISHSSVERFIGPDATITLDFALARLTGVIDKLVVYPERMQKNLDRMGGLVHSQRVLLALTQAGLSREDSLCAGAAQRDEGVGIGRRSCRCSTCSRPTRRCRSGCQPTSSNALFDLGYHFKHVDTIFDRVFGRQPNRFAKHKFFTCAARNTRLFCAPGSQAGGLMDTVQESPVRIWSRTRSATRTARPAGRLFARAVARLDRAARVGEHPSFAWRSPTSP